MSIQREIKEVLARLDREPFHRDALQWACHYLHLSFILKDRGEDTPEMMLGRGRVFEYYGHQLLHAYADASETSNESLLRIMRAVVRLLESPVEDSDKISHLKETMFTPKRIAKIKELTRDL